MKFNSTEKSHDLGGSDFVNPATWGTLNTLNIVTHSDFQCTVNLEIVTALTKLGWGHEVQQHLKCCEGITLQIAM